MTEQILTHGAGPGLLIVLQVTGWLGLGVLVGRRLRTAGARYGFWLSVLLGVLLIPVVTPLRQLAPRAAATVAALPATAAPEVSVAAPPTVQPTEAEPVVPALSNLPEVPATARSAEMPRELPPEPADVPVEPTTTVIHVGPGTRAMLPRVAVAFLIVWTIGVLIRSARLMTSVLRIRRIVARSGEVDGVMKSTAERVQHALNLRTLRVRVGLEAQSPLLVGFLRPCVLVPGGLRLDSAQWECVLLHEAAHLRRGDVWVVVLQWLSARCSGSIPSSGWPVVNSDGPAKTFATSLSCGSREPTCTPKRC